MKLLLILECRPSDAGWSIVIYWPFVCTLCSKKRKPPNFWQ